MKIEVFDNRIEPALKSLKRAVLKEGVSKEMKRRAFSEKPSVRRKREQAEARKKRRKAERRAGGGTTEDLRRPEKANEGARMMGRKHKNHVAAQPDPVEISTSDRAILAEAYQAGLIVAWKRDAERGYRLTVTGRADDYVEVTRLTRYLERLKGVA